MTLHRKDRVPYLIYSEKFVLSIFIFYHCLAFFLELIVGILTIFITVTEYHLCFWHLGNPEITDAGIGYLFSFRKLNCLDISGTGLKVGFLFPSFTFTNIQFDILLLLIDIQKGLLSMVEFISYWEQVRCCPCVCWPLHWLCWPFLSSLTRTSKLSNTSFRPTSASFTPKCLWRNLITVTARQRAGLIR